MLVVLSDKRNIEKLTDRAVDSVSPQHPVVAAVLHTAGLIVFQGYLNLYIAGNQSL
ncbi:hypothetical protein D3C72_2150530 [compost metagenome]